MWCRSYDALQGSPVTSQLIPALGVIAFAVCGLEPLMRLCRIIFLQVATIYSYQLSMALSLSDQTLTILFIIFFRGMIIVGRRVVRMVLWRLTCSRCCCGLGLCLSAGMLGSTIIYYPLIDICPIGILTTALFVSGH